MPESNSSNPATLPKLERNMLVSFYVAGGLRELIPIYPLYAIMFGEHGVTPFELSALFIIWAAVGMLVEVPSGALADRFSRKWLVILAGVFKSAAFISWFLYQDFWGYAIGFILWGTGSSLRSGAFEALLYELLQKWGAEHRFAYHHGRIRGLATITVMLGEAMGGILIVFGFDAVLLVSAAVPLIASLPFMIYVKDVDRGPPTSYASYMVSGIQETLHQPALVFILILSTFLLTIHGVFDEYVPPLLLEHGFEISTIAFLAIPIFSAQALGQYLADRFVHLPFEALIRLMIVGAVVLMPSALTSGVVAIISIAGFFLLYGLAGTLLETRLQDQIEGDARATVTSLIGLGDSVGAIAWFLVFGVLSDLLNFANATLGFAILALLLCLIAERYRLLILKPEAH